MFFIQPYTPNTTHVRWDSPHKVNVLKKVFYDFWSDGDLHGEKISRMSISSRKSGLPHFGSYIFKNCSQAAT